MKHFGHFERTMVKLDFWLVVDAAGMDKFNARPSVRAVAQAPALSRTERAINLKIDLPRALFEQPAIVASIKVDAPSQSIQIDATALAEAVRQSIGMDVHIRIANPGEEE